MSVPEPFIVAGPPNILRPLLEIFQADRETTVHDVARNNQTDPEILFISMERQRVDAFRAALRSLVTIEDDHPITNDEPLPPLGPLP